MSKVTVDIAIGLIGILSFWLGMSMMILFVFKFMYHFSNKEFA
jgi:hypothetical protein